MLPAGLGAGYNFLQNPTGGFNKLLNKGGAALGSLGSVPYVGGVMDRSKQAMDKRNMKKALIIPRLDA